MEKTLIALIVSSKFIKLFLNEVISESSFKGYTFK